MNLYSQLFNPAYVNPQHYQEILRFQQYQLEQDKEVLNAVKAMHDLCEAINKLDEAHKQEAFNGCLVEIARASHWQ